MVVEYDKLEWHVEGVFPKGTPPEQGFVHIGMFLTWLILNGLVDLDWAESNGLLDEVEAVAARRQTACALRGAIGGTLSSDELAPEGRAFTAADYTPPFGYGEDWRRAFGRAADRYAVPDGWATYEAIAPALDRSYREWVAAGRPEYLPVPRAVPGWLHRLLRLPTRNKPKE